MKRLGKITTFVFISLASGIGVTTTVLGQNYPSQGPSSSYPQQQPPSYSGQPPYGQQDGQQAPPYGQQRPYRQQPDYGQQPPAFTAQQLDAMVGRIGLDPDPLLAQVLTASTFWDQIPDAAAWARAHSYIVGEALARSIQEDRLPWDPSVIALLPFPAVLDMMAGDMNWTQQLGSAVLADRGSVMDAIQRQRSIALNYGYLRSNAQIHVVTTLGDIEILPADPAVIYVPYYNPYVVYTRPRPGFYVGGAISFGPRIVVGTFAPWGWGGVALGWREHRIIVNNRPWERGWANRNAYVHPYPAPRPRVEERHIERHELREYRRPEHGPERRDGHR